MVECESVMRICGYSPIPYSPASSVKLFETVFILHDVPKIFVVERFSHERSKIIFGKLFSWFFFQDVFFNLLPIVISFAFLKYLADYLRLN